MVGKLSPLALHSVFPKYWRGCAFPSVSYEGQDPPRAKGIVQTWPQAALE